jgi:uncharacterized protein (DUF433 family)
MTDDPLRSGGNPCFRDLGISVSDELDGLVLGVSFDGIVADCRELMPKDVRACSAYAAGQDRTDRSRSRCCGRLPVVRGG